MTANDDPAGPSDTGVPTRPINLGGPLAAKPPLGRLAQVDLRQEWESEALGFTPWLAQPENIKLLGDTVGIDLEVQSTEVGVGPFRADILCRDTRTSHYVLIENQLERTDHVHLGQLLTYAAGLKAVTIIWIAARFADEHRAALDWLNEETSDGIDFFGLEIELWQVDGPPMAPTFNIVSRPNDWTKVVKVRSGELSETKRLHLDFWTQFQAFLEERDSVIRLRRPAPEAIADFAVGRTDFALVAWNLLTPDRPGVTVDGVGHHSGVYLRMSGADAKAHFELIRQRYRDVIEERLSSLATVRWLDGTDASSTSIALSTPSTPWEPQTWPHLDEWMAASLEAMHDLFRPIVKGLDASEYMAADEAALTGDGIAAPPWGGVGSV